MGCTWWDVVMDCRDVFLEESIESGRGLLTALIEAKGPLRDPEVFADPRSKD